LSHISSAPNIEDSSAANVEDITELHIKSSGVLSHTNVQLKTNVSEISSVSISRAEVVNGHTFVLL
jgi:hypothetical protein